MTLTAAILCNGDLNERTIPSVIDHVDEILLVDTGIVDDSLARAWAAAGCKLRVIKYRWTNDFAAARNFCMKNISDGWYMLLDSDEWYNIHGDIKSQLTEDCLLVATEDKSYYRERLIRVASDYRWVGRTHEALEGSGTRGQLTAATTGSPPKTAKQVQLKLNRDLILLQLEDLSNPRWVYYLGQTYEDLKQYTQAIQAYQNCWKLPGWAEQAAWACYRAAVCHIHLKNIPEALIALTTGLSKSAIFPELAWLAGWCCYQLNRRKECTVWAKMAQAITDTQYQNDRIGFRNTTGWYRGPENLLHWVPLTGHKASNIIVLGVGHANTTISTRQLAALGWNLGPAGTDDWAEHPQVRQYNSTGQGNPEQILKELPQPWVIKDPRFAYGCLGQWRPFLASYTPTLLWLTKDLQTVRESFIKRGEDSTKLEHWADYCKTQFDLWPWAKFTVDAHNIQQAVSLWRTQM